MSADIETERDERGHTLSFALLDPTERAVAAALFRVSESFGVDCAGQKWGSYDETPDGMQWLAGDASYLVANWREEPTWESLRRAAEDTALWDPEGDDDRYLTAALEVLADAN